MHEKPIESKFENPKNIELFEKSFEEMLQIKIGEETSRENVAEAFANRQVVNFVVTADYTIFISDDEHVEILESNGISSESSYIPRIEGFYGPDENHIYFYEHRDQFDDVFGELKEKSGVSEDAFNELCEKVVRKKISEFCNTLK